MLSAGVTIMDPIALTMIEKFGGDFGRERLFSSIGMAIFSPITGIMIDYSSRGLGYTDYSAAFYTYDVLLVISTMSVLMMPLGEKLPADNVFRDLWNLLKMPHVIAFIIFLFVLGNFWGFIESFLFLYLKELGAPNYLLGELCVEWSGVLMCQLRVATVSPSLSSSCRHHHHRGHCEQYTVPIWCGKNHTHLRPR